MSCRDIMYHIHLSSSIRPSALADVISCLGHFDDLQPVIHFHSGFHDVHSVTRCLQWGGGQWSRLAGLIPDAIDFSRSPLHAVLLLSMLAFHAVSQDWPLHSLCCTGSFPGTLHPSHRPGVSTHGSCGTVEKVPAVILVY